MVYTCLEYLDVSVYRRCSTSKSRRATVSYLYALPIAIDRICPDLLLDSEMVSCKAQVCSSQVEKEYGQNRGSRSGWEKSRCRSNSSGSHFLGKTRTSSTGASYWYEEENGGKAGKSKTNSKEAAGKEFVWEDDKLKLPLLCVLD